VRIINHEIFFNATPLQTQGLLINDVRHTSRILTLSGLQSQMSTQFAHREDDSRHNFFQAVYKEGLNFDFCFQPAKH